MDILDTALGGMKTRFIHNGKNPTLMVLASSKRSEKSFLEEHMKKKLNDEDSSSIIVDEPVWKVKPANTYCGKKFYIAQGNRFLASEIIPDGMPLKPWKDKGYRILEVPIEFKSDFKDDIDRALCDFAGISSSDLTKYISGARFTEVRTNKYENPFKKEIITVGNAPDDFAQYSDYFDMSKVDPMLKSRPLFIHLDMSVSGDKTGIAGTWILGKKHSSTNESSSTELYYKVAFGVAVKAPKGYQVSFAKNREFIYWLKEQGFNIKGVSTDTYQNASLAQDLLSKGYPYEIVSVDRVNPKSHICEPYAYFKNVIYEKRLQVFDCELLTEEVLNLERNGSTGKIDHPDGGRSGSKDLCDAVCGSIWCASTHGDEFAFEFGENMQIAIEASANQTVMNRKQVELDMEEQMNQLLDPIIAQQGQLSDGFMDFGMGKASTNYSQLYLLNGIIIG